MAGEMIQRGVAKGWPRVAGKCPACDGNSLFVGKGGYVTCSLLGCPDPCAPSKALGVESPDDLKEER